MSKYILSALITSAILIAGVSGAYSSEKLKVSLKCDTVDLCPSSSKRLVLTVNMGEIKTADSLTGYNFRIKYDPKKIDFQIFSTLGSISEVFDKYSCAFKVREANDSSYYIKGWATNFANIPAAGNKPLFAIAGDFLSTNYDSSAISLDYIEFTTEFKKEVVCDTVYGFIKQLSKPERYVNLKSNTDSLNYASDETKKSFNLSLNSGVIDNITDLSFTASLSDEKNFEIESITSNNGDKATVDKNANVYNLKIKQSKNGFEYLKVNVNRKTTDSANAYVKIELKDVNANSCVNELLGSLITLTAKEKKVNVENDLDNELKIYDKNGNFDIVTRNVIEKIEIYDINGFLVYNNTDIKSDNAQIRMEDKAQGVYFLRLTCENKKFVNKILIKN